MIAVQVHADRLGIGDQGSRPADRRGGLRRLFVAADRASQRVEVETEGGDGLGRNVFYITKLLR